MKYLETIARMNLANLRIYKIGLKLRTEFFGLFGLMIAN
nr:MAG TPA: hypothetical protein [Caudoviricetes sp.]